MLIILYNVHTIILPCIIFSYFLTSFKPSRNQKMLGISCQSPLTNLIPTHLRTGTWEWSTSCNSVWKLLFVWPVQTDHPMKLITSVKQVMTLENCNFSLNNSCSWEHNFHPKINTYLSPDITSQGILKPWRWPAHSWKDQGYQPGCSNSNLCTWSSMRYFRAAKRNYGFFVWGCNLITV